MAAGHNENSQSDTMEHNGTLGKHAADTSEQNGTVDATATAIDVLKDVVKNQAPHQFPA